jgi:hypothetical protein
VPCGVDNSIPRRALWRPAPEGRPSAVATSSSQSAAASTFCAKHVTRLATYRSGRQAAMTQRRRPSPRQQRIPHAAPLPPALPPALLRRTRQPSAGRVSGSPSLRRAVFTVRSPLPPHPCAHVARAAHAHRVRGIGGVGTPPQSHHARLLQLHACQTRVHAIQLMRTVPSASAILNVRPTRPSYCRRTKSNALAHPDRRKNDHTCGVQHEYHTCASTRTQ